MTVRLDIATGGRPLEAITGAVLACTEELDRNEILPKRPVQMTVAHDDGCPCYEEAAPLLDCTCEIVRVLLWTGGMP